MLIKTELPAILVYGVLFIAIGAPIVIFALFNEPDSVTVYPVALDRVSNVTSSEAVGTAALALVFEAVPQVVMPPAFSVQFGVAPPPTRKRAAIRGSARTWP